MAIMRVNVRPAPKVRWNKRTQRRDEVEHSVSVADYGIEEQTHAQYEEVENENSKETYGLSQPSPPDPALQSDSGVVETMFDASSFIVANVTTEVTPIEAKEKINKRSKRKIDLGRLDFAMVDSIAKNSAMLEEENLDIEEPILDGEDCRKDAAWQKIVWQLMPETPVGRALVAATQRLESSDIDTASLDAQVILANILGKDRAWLFAHHDYMLTKEEANLFTDRIVRRMGHEPVAYLIGRKEFYGLDFAVDRRVLIPRPETELLVDAVLSHLEMQADEMPVGHQLRLADVGTGCGAIAISVATNAPDVQVYATDISIDALEIARTNIRKLDNRCQVSLLQGDLLKPLQNKADMHKVDIIAANLPYINSSDYAGLAPDVRNYEPQLALEAGPQGLDTIARLLQQAPLHLHPNGVIMLEIGYDQGELVVGLVKQLVPEARVIDLRQDYNGKDRLVTVAL